MFRPRVIPCLLLKGEGLVKTVQFANPTYIGDPLNAVKIFNDTEADELIFLDIEASIKNQRSLSVDLIKSIGDEAFMPFAVGGGINSIAYIKTVINSGAEKVIINSAAYTNKDLLRQTAEIFGSQSLVISIDARKNESGRYVPYSHSGTRIQDRNIVEHAQEMEALGAGEIFINSIDRDGTFAGYDIDLIKLISESVDIPVIACGGASCIEDFPKAIEEGSASAVAAGSIFVFIGSKRAVLIDYPEQEELFELFE